MKNIPFRITTATVGLLLPAIALAHGGSSASHHDSALVAGLLHPFTGIDHLAAMFAIGLWSARAVRPVWLAPAAFLALLLVGTLAGFAGFVVPAVEPMIAASLLVTGLLIASHWHLSGWLSAALAGGFAFFHGAAHGSELGGAGQWLALGGMGVSTALLHLSGLLAGRTVLRPRRLGTAAGAAVALLGTLFLVRLA